MQLLFAAPASDQATSKPDAGFLDRRPWLAALALCILVAITTYLCLRLPREEGAVIPIWLVNAWASAALIRSKTRHWPLFVTAAYLGDLAAALEVGHAAVTAAGLAACNALAWVAVAWPVRRFCGPNFDIGRAKHLAIFTAAALGAALLSALAADWLLEMIAHSGVPRGLASWTGSRALGLLALAPPLLVLTQKVRTPFAWRESWTLLVLTAVTLAAFFIAKYPLLFVVSAALTLPTWRMGLPGAVAGIVIISIIGAVAVFTGSGPTIIGAISDPVVGLQIFVTFSFFTSVPVAVARDADEILRARLRAAVAEAEHATQVKTEFLANMSHELRTPLTSIVGFTRLATEQPDLSPVTRDYIDRVNEASRALLCAVNDILDFSKLEAGQVSFHPEAMAVAPFLRIALDLFTPQAAAKDLTLRLEDATPAGLTVTLDPDRMRQVLLNLVGNAVKFTDRGEVTLGASYDETAGRLTVTVSDTGAGIAPEGLTLLFKRFSQVDGSLTRGHGGTGLGLAICKGIVEAQGGDIGAASQLGCGSRFTFAIPAPRTDAPSVDAVEAGDFAARIGARVLVTDDHPANRELVKLFLAPMGAEITEAADGEAAVALADAQPFDVILMDLRMPKLDGFGAVAAIRTGGGLNRTTPILAFTADAERLFGGRLEDAGFDGAVAKPVEPRQLIAAIATAMAQAEAADERDVSAA